MDIVSWVLVALVLLGALLGAVERFPYRRRTAAVRLATLPRCGCGRPIPSGCRWCLTCWSRPVPPTPISPTIHTLPGGTP